MSKSSKKNQKRTQFWKHHIKQWSESGMSQNAYCRQNDLRPNQFTYWKSKFKNQAPSPEFVQVPSTQLTQVLNLSEQKGLRLNIDNEFQIEIPATVLRAGTPFKTKLLRNHRFMRLRY